MTMNKSKLWHALALVLFVAGLAVRDLQADPALTSALHIGGAVLATAGLIVAMVSQALFGTPTPPNPNAASIAAQVATKVVGSMLFFVVAVACAGCLSSAPVVPVTAANQAQISTCENTATLHDGAIIGDFVFGGIGTGLGSAAALVTDSNTKTGLGVGGAIAGAGVVVGTAIAGLTASNFANSQCSEVVGPLPTVATPAGK
jgi:hypothetical protein